MGKPLEPFATVTGRYDDESRRTEIDVAVGKRRHATRQANLGVFTGYRIGLDIGNGNIGWCILFERGDVPHFVTAESLAAHNAALAPGETRTQLPEPHLFVPLGTHKFTARNPDGVSLSRQRAEARSARKLQDARRYRRWHVKKVLVEAGLLPKEGEPLQGLTDIKADRLRVVLLRPGAANHPHDLGRALYNLFKRRGWMPPIGRTGEGEDSKFGTQATAKYEDALREFECETVGQFLQKCQDDHFADHGSAQRRLLRKRHKPLEWQKNNRKDKPKEDSKPKSYELFPFLSPTLKLIEDEANLLRERQAAVVPIPDPVWRRIVACARFRRPLKGRLPGRCQYLPDEFRCVRALPSFQDFRIRQQIDNLRLAGGGRLTGETLERADEVLRMEPRATLRQMERALNVGHLDVGKDDSRTLLGAETDILLTDVLGEAWTNIRDIDTRDGWVMRFLRRREAVEAQGRIVPMEWTEDDEERLTAGCAGAFGPDALERIDKEVVPHLADQFADISAKAARILAQGYRDGLDHDQRLDKLEYRDPKIELFEGLPYYGRVMPEVVVDARSFAPAERTAEEELKYGRMANPDVHVVLNRIRAVVNAIIDMMGGILPTTCTVEIARDALSEEAAKDKAEHMRQRAKLRATIEQEITRVLDGAKPRGPRLDRMVDRWLAAHRQGWRDYDGSVIPRSLVLDGDTYQLDHVSPAAFGEFRQSNLFVSRLNQQKGRDLPWNALKAHREQLTAFAAVGLEQAVDALIWVLKNRNVGKKRAELEKRRAQLASDLKSLLDGEHGMPDAALLEHLRRSARNPLDRLVESEEGITELRRLKKSIRPGDQAALFRKLGPFARLPDGDYAARDVANIGWSTKLARRYFLHLGARCVSVKPWAIHFLRCMFNIDKSGNRHDLRNHAVDAFFAAHFDERVMNPAFARLRGRNYEDLYKSKALEEALAETPDVFAALNENIQRLSETLPAIATAHRPDNQWNPGDAEGGSFGAIGGQNIYSFKPSRSALKSALALIAKIAGNEAAQPPSKATVAKWLFYKGNNQKLMDLRFKLEATLSSRYLDRKGAETKITSLKLETAKPLRKQPGAFVDIESKFAIVAPTTSRERSVVSIAGFSEMSSRDRAAMFSGNGSVYRAADMFEHDHKAMVSTGLTADGRMVSYEADMALRLKADMARITIPTKHKKKPPERIRNDILGRHIHRRRKIAGDLAPVPYRLFGE